MREIQASEGSFFLDPFIRNHCYSTRKQGFWKDRKDPQLLISNVKIQMTIECQTSNLQNQNT